MRRWLCILLLSFLPFQFSWAVAAAYCAHESAGQASHFGHHEHRHHGHTGQPSTGASEPSSQGQPGQGQQDQQHKASEHTQTKAPGAFDADCSHCHGNCAAVPLPLKPPADFLASVRPVSLLAAAAMSPPLAPPERPQWPSLA